MAHQKEVTIRIFRLGGRSISVRMITQTTFVVDSFPDT